MSNPGRRSQVLTEVQNIQEQDSIYSWWFFSVTKKVKKIMFCIFVFSGRYILQFFVCAVSLSYKSDPGSRTTIPRGPLPRTCWTTASSRPSSRTQPPSYWPNQKCCILIGRRMEKAVTWHRAGLVVTNRRAGLVVTNHRAGFVEANQTTSSSDMQQGNIWQGYKRFLTHKKIMNLV